MDGDPGTSAEPSTELTAERLSRELVGYIRRCSRRRWCEGTSGNFSVRVDGEPPFLLITRTSTDKSRIRPGDLTRIGLDGRTLDEPAARPSAESAIHLAISRQTGARAILHTCSIWSVLVADVHGTERGCALPGYGILKGIEGVRTRREQVFVPVIQDLQDTSSLADRASRLIARSRDLRALLIVGHGLYTWAGSLQAAYLQLEAFEFLFEARIRQRSLETR